MDIDIIKIVLGIEVLIFGTKALISGCSILFSSKDNHKPENIQNIIEDYQKNMEEEKDKEYMARLKNWLVVNKSSLIHKSLELQNDGKNIIECYKTQFINLAKNNLKLFFERYYKFNQDSQMGTDDEPITDFNFESDYYHVNEDLFRQLALDEYIIHKETVRYSSETKPYLKGYSCSSKSILNDIDSTLRNAVLNNNERFNINDIFINQELDIDLYKYMDYGPFEWLRESGFLNPEKIKIAINNKISDRKLDNNQPSITLSSNESDNLKHANIEELNNIINIPSKPDPEKIQHAVEYKTSDRKLDKNQTATSPLSNESDNLKYISIDELNDIINTPPNPDIGRQPGIQKNNNTFSYWKTIEYKRKKEKYISDSTDIYILRSPFKTKQGWEVKIGESTNIEQRLKAYRLYWLNYFEPICCIRGIVSDEDKVLNAFEKYHLSGEYFDLPEDLIEKIRKIEKLTLQDLLLIA